MQGSKRPLAVVEIPLGPLAQPVEVVVVLTIQLPYLLQHDAFLPALVQKLMKKNLQKAVAFGAVELAIDFDHPRVLPRNSWTNASPFLDAFGHALGVASSCPLGSFCPASSDSLMSTSHQMAATLQTANFDPHTHWCPFENCIDVTNSCSNQTVSNFCCHNHNHNRHGPAAPDMSGHQDFDEDQT